MINTFMLARERSLVEFVKRVCEISRGKAHFNAGAVHLDGFHAEEDAAGGLSKQIKATRWEGDEGQTAEGLLPLRVSKHTIFRLHVQGGGFAVATHPRLPV